MVTRPTVLVTAPRAVQVLARYEEELGAAGYDVTSWPTVERLEEHELLPLVGNVDALICGDDRITTRVLDAAPRLRVIAKWGTGIDSIDVDSARRRGVLVRNSPGAFSEPVADTVLGYVLLFARQLDRMADDMRSGLWHRRPLRALNDCTLGIVGLGASGRAVARRASAFGMRIIGNCLQPPAPDEQRQLGLTMVTLDTLLAESDFVTLHADLRAENRHLIDRHRIEQMKDGAVLINTARGQLVDETALTTALVGGRLAGAALDVFEQEPLSPESPLRRLPNVYLAPHNANASFAAAERVHANTIQHVLQALGTNRYE
jgi:D-3-phosphoglycerate dehydrogenase / 2-oxoglutarate reductase